MDVKSAFRSPAFPGCGGATPAQRRKWHIEPHGIAIYWDDLDDGIEVEHLFR